jgi:DNA repair protein RadA/Sms
MGIKNDSILLSSECICENIIDMVTLEKPKIVFIDSIQTIKKKFHSKSSRNSHPVERMHPGFLLEASKRTNIPILLIVGHITKEGSIEVPKILEHLVDTVRYFEGDKLNYYRILRGIKRFGAVGDIAVFEMKSEGLNQIIIKAYIFITPDHEQRNGSAISVVMEGSRAMSVEVQALVSRTSYSQARRMSEGLDNRRLILMAAVIEKFLS